MYLIILIFTSTVYLTWRFGTRNFGYWKKKGVKHDEPVFFFGNMYKLFMLKLSPCAQIAEWYNKFPKEKYVGVHLAGDLALVLRDPELIKHVLVTDFSYFYQRGIHTQNQVTEPLLQNLFSADGDVWKLVRQRLTPAFSGAKINAMFPLIEKTAQKMLSVTKIGSQDLKELLMRYITDFIGICGFGLDFDSLTDESSMFIRLAKRIFKFTTRDAIVCIGKCVAPKLFKHVYFFTPEIEETTMHIVKEILKERNYVPSGRNDFMDLLLEIKQKGKMVGDSLEHFNSDGTPKTVQLELDDLLLAAQVFMFFGAAFETTSSASSFLLHELAFNPEAQERCHTEIDEVLRKHGGKICYEAIKEMKYLEMALKEAIRLHPSLGYLIRRSNRKYTFPGTSLTIKKDVYVLVSLQALNKDPKSFIDPDTFRPERFSSDHISKYVFMPFGEGPRACMGERLGVMLCLVAVATLLSRFNVKPAPTSRRWPLIDPGSFIVDNVLGGLPLSLEPREREPLS